jgi:hypothetical protein
MIGIFAVDPGGHTGVAWSIIDEGASTSVDAMRARVNRGSKTLEGPEAGQIEDLFWLWRDFVQEAQKQVQQNEINLVLEDFVLRPGQHAGGKDGTSPERIAWGFEGYRMGQHDALYPTDYYHPIRWQMPSAASRWRTREKLTKAEAWVVGKEHERSAYSHMILRLNTVMDFNTTLRRQRAR